MSIEIKLLKVLLLSCIVSMSYAQVNIQSAGTGNSYSDHALIKLSQRALEEVEEEVEGSPYMYDEFIKGSVSTDKTNYDNVPLRYNLLKDRVEFKQNNNVYVLDSRLNIGKIDMGGDILVVDKYLNKKKLTIGYFILLEEGSTKLLKKSVVIYKPKQEPKALESSSTPAKYVRKPDAYYCKIGEGELFRVTSLKKTIANFPNKQIELIQFAREENISAKNENELIKLINYYNTL